MSIRQNNIALPATTAAILVMVLAVAAWVGLVIGIITTRSANDAITYCSCVPIAVLTFVGSWMYLN